MKVLLSAYQPRRDLFSKVQRRLAWTHNACPLDLKLDRAIVSFTFDDFPKSAADIAAPMLEAVGVRATYYVCAGFQSRKNHFGPLYTWDDAKRLRDAGHELGCHTFGHIDCAQESVTTVESHCDANAEALRAILGTDALTSFAYPYGETSPALKKRFSERFTTARGIQGGVNRGRIDMTQLRSEALYGADVYARVCDRISEAVSARGWLTLFTHDVCDTPSAWGTSTTMFQRIIEAVKAADVEILPIRDAAKKALQ